VTADAAEAVTADDAEAVTVRLRLPAEESALLVFRDEPAAER